MTHPEFSVISIEKAPDFNSTHEFAVDALRRARIAEKQVADAQQRQEEFNTLSESKWNPRRRWQLRKWLKQKGYYSRQGAVSTIEYDIRRGNQDSNKNREMLEDDLDIFRKSLVRYEEDDKLRLHQLLLTNDMPTDIADAFSESGAANIADWLAHKPVDEHGQNGATNDQLARLLEWSLEKTQELAQNPEEVNKLSKDYFNKINARVAEGALHPEWATQIAHVDRVVIGDIFERNYVGINNSITSGSYNRKKRAIILWPYEEPSSSIVEKEHLFNHEMTHSMGIVSHSWLDEGLTERIASLIDGHEDSPDFATYEKEREIIENLIQNADQEITDYDISGCFVGQDGEKNEQQLRELFKQAYNGLDVLGMALDLGDAISPEKLPHGHEKKRHATMMVRFAVNEILSSALTALREQKITFDETVGALMQLAEATEDRDVRLVYTHCARIFIPFLKK